MMDSRCAGPCDPGHRWSENATTAGPAAADDGRARAIRTDLAPRHYLGRLVSHHHDRAAGRRIAVGDP